MGGYPTLLAFTSLFSFLFLPPCLSVNKPKDHFFFWPPPYLPLSSLFSFFSPPMSRVPPPRSAAVAPAPIGAGGPVRAKYDPLAPRAPVIVTHLDGRTEEVVPPQSRLVLRRSALTPYKWERRATDKAGIIARGQQAAWKQDAKRSTVFPWIFQKYTANRMVSLDIYKELYEGTDAMIRNSVWRLNRETKQYDWVENPEVRISNEAEKLIAKNIEVMWGEVADIAARMSEGGSDPLKDPSLTPEGLIQALSIWFNVGNHPQMHSDFGIRWKTQMEERVDVYREDIIKRNQTRKVPFSDTKLDAMVTSFREYITHSMNVMEKEIVTMFGPTQGGQEVEPGINPLFESPDQEKLRNLALLDAKERHEFLVKIGKAKPDPTPEELAKKEAAQSKRATAAIRRQALAVEEVDDAPPMEDVEEEKEAPVAQPIALPAPPRRSAAPPAAPATKKKGAAAAPVPAAAPAPPVRKAAAVPARRSRGIVAPPPEDPTAEDQEDQGGEAEAMATSVTPAEE